MGSFNATCIVSNLPIEAGTPVRFLALARNAYNVDGNDHACYVTGRWQLYGVPIKAEYNDYGSVENIKDNFTSKLFFEGLALGVVEVGVGDNSCHDVAVRHDMNQKSWLEALWEGRVKVDDNYILQRLLEKSRELDQQVEKLTGTNPKLASFYEAKEYEPAIGIPTFKRIEKLFADNEMKLSSGDFDSGFLIDEVGSGFVRVRRHSDYDGYEINSVLPLLHDAGYAAMITAGSGSYSRKSEILVAAMPSTDPKIFIHVNHAVEDYNKARPISQAMIREDVWNILLNTPIDNWLVKMDKNYFRISALKFLKEELTNQINNDTLETYYTLRDDKNIFEDSLGGSEGVSGFTFREAFRLCLKSGKSFEEMSSYVINLADTIYVQLVYSILHGQWHPTTNSSQDGNWKEHRDFLTKLLNIKGVWEDEDEDEDDE